MDYLNNRILDDQADDVSRLSSESLESWRCSTTRQSNHRGHKKGHKKNTKNSSKYSSLEPACLLNYDDTHPLLPNLALLQRKQKKSIKLGDTNPAETRLLNTRQSFQEQLNKNFPPHVHQEILELCVSNIEDAYYMAIEDLIESPKISRLQARMIHSLLQHHMVHHEYTDKLQPQTPYRPNNSKVTLTSKQTKYLPKFSGTLPDWLTWK